jgi:hypothetical protein
LVAAPVAAVERVAAGNNLKINFKKNEKII